MADLGWLAEGGKYLGAGAAGWIGRIFAESNKKSRMRRHLYKELGYNVMLLAKAFHDFDKYNKDFPDMATTGASAIIVERVIPQLRFEYFKHAMNDMDTFHGIRESLFLQEAIDKYRKLDQFAGHQLVVVARDAVGTTIVMITRGDLKAARLFRGIDRRSLHLVRGLRPDYNPLRSFERSS